MYKIVRREAFSDTTFLWDVHAPDVAASAQPGHFVMLRLREGGERIPLTVADYDRFAARLAAMSAYPAARRFPDSRRSFAAFSKSSNAARRSPS